MIDINLVPENLRKRRRTILSSSAVKFQIPLEAVVGFCVLLCALCLILLGIFFVRHSQYAKLNKQWKAIAASKQNVDSIINEIRSLQNKINSIEQITTGKRIFWSPKLNDTSDSIPRGVWLTRISLGQKVLLIEGSSVSKMGDEMLSVGAFVSNLKKQKNFMKNLKNIEVGSIQRRQVQSVQLADFLITVKLQ